MNKEKLSYKCDGSVYLKGHNGTWSCPKEIGKKLKLWRVDIIESERGWGAKIDDIILFVSREKAEAFVKEHNAKNNLPYVPDIYWKAEFVGQL